MGRGIDAPVSAPGQPTNTHLFSQRAAQAIVEAVMGLGHCVCLGARRMVDGSMATSIAVDTTFVIVLSLALLPGALWAQQASGIAGVVRDATGAVLPGVTV